MKLSKELKMEIKRLLKLHKAMVAADEIWKETSCDYDKKENLWSNRHITRTDFYNNAPDMLACIKEVWEQVSKKK